MQPAHISTGLALLGALTLGALIGAQILNYDYLQRLERIDGYAEIWRDDKKFVELKAGLYATLFFKHFDASVNRNDAVREALIECWHDY